MSEIRDYKVELRFVRGYEFVATFPECDGLPPIVFDEPPDSKHLLAPGMSVVPEVAVK